MPVELLEFSTSRWLVAARHVDDGWAGDPVAGVIAGPDGEIDAGDIQIDGHAGRVSEIQIGADAVGQGSQNEGGIAGSGEDPPP